MIKSFKHAGLQKFFTTGSKAGIRPDHATKLQLQLMALNSATKPTDMAAPGWDLHPLKGALAGNWSISVNGNWRLVFAFEGTDVAQVDYMDYH
ncbi:MAG TPA: type II toxin-antitoxin system RelE/ParE family toxin [Acidisarcina sp.]